MLERVEGDPTQAVGRVVPQFPGGIGMCRFVERDCDEYWDDPSRCRVDGI
jgi:hypothetical protein